MVRQLRIAHVTATFPPYQAGTGIVAFHNAAELARRGHDVHVFTATVANAPAEETIDGVTVHRLRPWLKHGNAAFVPQLYWHLRSFEVVHVHLPFYGGAEAVLALRARTKVPIITTHHQDVVIPGIIGLISEGHDRLVARNLMENAKFACFTSQDYGQHSKFAQGAALDICVLPNGVDIDRFRPGPSLAGLAKEIGTVGSQVVLFVGALDRSHYFKGVDRLLEAVSKLGNPNVKFVIVGSGDLRDDYIRHAVTLNVSERVVFPGYVPDELLADYYRLADVTVLPSITVGEAFGLVLLESLACGTPVIASNLPGVRTVVADGVDGYLVEPGNAADLANKLGTMLGLSKEQRQAMGEAGRRKVEERYSWKSIGDRLEQIYGAALSGSTHVSLSSMSMRELGT